MNQVVAINNRALPLKEYNGQRVVTFKEIDFVHDRPEGTASRNFRENRERFIENDDYFSVALTSDEIRRQFGVAKNAGRTITLITKMGYLMLVKSFTDELSWKIQRQIVTSYFESRLDISLEARIAAIEQRLSAGNTLPLPGQLSSHITPIIDIPIAKPEKKIYTTKDLQEVLKLGRNSVMNLIHTEQIKSVRAGRRILVPAWALDKFMKLPTGGVTL